MGGRSAKEDLERYRNGYPDLEDDPTQNDNLKFYKNEIPSRPEGDYIDIIHSKWFGNYDLLESHHGYIQWIFPIREHGVNMLSQVLQPHEIEGIKADPQCRKRVIRSYGLMLDFYGMQLSNEETGALTRSKKWKHRYAHLNRSFHNYLRITRILKSLGELGLEHFKIHFITLMTKEVFEDRELTSCEESCVNFWVPTLRNDKEREEALGKIAAYRSDSSSDEGPIMKKHKRTNSDDDFENYIRKIDKKPMKDNIPIIPKEAVKYDKESDPYYETGESQEIEKDSKEDHNVIVTSDDTVVREYIATVVDGYELSSDEEDLLAEETQEEASETNSQDKDTEKKPN